MAELGCYADDQVAPSDAELAGLQAELAESSHEMTLGCFADGSTNTIPETQHAVPHHAIAPVHSGRCCNDNANQRSLNGKTLGHWRGAN